MFERPVYKILLDRVSELGRFIQVLAGPRQTGKTTLARQTMEALDLPSHYASADEPTLKDSIWIEQQWEAARAKVRSGGKDVSPTSLFCSLGILTGKRIRHVDLPVAFSKVILLNQFDALEVFP